MINFLTTVHSLPFTRTPLLFVVFGLDTHVLVGTVRICSSLLRNTDQSFSVIVSLTLILTLALFDVGWGNELSLLCRLATVVDSDVFILTSSCSNLMTNWAVSNSEVSWCIQFFKSRQCVQKQLSLVHEIDENWLQLPWTKTLVPPSWSCVFLWCVWRHVPRDGETKKVWYVSHYDAILN